VKYCESNAINLEYTVIWTECKFSML